MVCFYGLRDVDRAGRGNLWLIRVAGRGCRVISVWDNQSTRAVARLVNMDSGSEGRGRWVSSCGCGVSRIELTRGRKSMIVAQAPAKPSTEGNSRQASRGEHHLSNPQRLCTAHNEANKVRSRHLF